MSKLLPIIDAVSGGSGRGISYYSAGMKCARKVVLDNEAKDGRLTREAEGQAPREYGKGGSEATRVGTIYHALCEQWHGKGITFPKALPSNDLYDTEYHEAERLFKFYKKSCRNDPGYWGHVEAVEMALPRGEEDIAALAEYFQFKGKLTALMDMVVRIDSEAHARIKLDHGVTLPGTGLYILDHKSSKQKANTGQWDMSMQFVAYQLMYFACTGEAPRGMIAANIVRHKKLEAGKSFNVHCVPWEEAERGRLALTTMLNVSSGLIEMSMPNPTACFDWFRKCYHYEQGNCERV